MPIDPSIPLGVRPLQIANPLEQLSTIAQLQGVREQTEARRLAAEEARTKRLRAEQVDQALQAAITVDPASGRITVDKARVMAHLPQIGGAAALELQDHLDAKETQANALVESKVKVANLHRELLGTLAHGVVISGGDPGLWRDALRTAKGLGSLPEDRYQELAALDTPAQILPLAQGYVQAAGIKPEKPEGFTLSEGQTRYDPTGKLIVAAPAKPVEEKHSAAYTEWQDYQKAGGTLGFDAYMTKDANRKAVRITVTGQGGPEDIKDAVQGMIDGRVPPMLPGRASTAYTAMLAEAQRRGYNLAGAATDWMATQKHIATMNGAQQLRLNQAVNALPEMLDKVETLATQWKGGGFPILNRANLALAKGGAYGPKAATVATQLESQIADVVADLGNVYMGGNSPTDHALQLAGKSLQADWSEPVLRQMVTLAKQNVQIRRNSINNTGVAGASADNPYLPAPPPPAVPPPTTRPGTNPFRK